MPAKRILVVEDDAETAELIAEDLQERGYIVSIANDGHSGLSAILKTDPDLVLCDINMPGMSGFEVMEQLVALAPSHEAVPFVFLTARDSELDAVSGLRLGADDFLTKDLSLPHLIARVNALLRRVDALRQPAAASEIVRRGPLTLDAERMQAQWDGKVVLLSLTEFWIVHALARNPGHVRNRQQLMDAANVVLDDNTITSHVKRIRRKFQSVDPKFDAVHTVYGMGYRWVE